MHTSTNLDVVSNLDLVYHSAIDHGNLLKKQLSMLNWAKTSPNMQFGKQPSFLAAYQHYTQQGCDGEVWGTPSKQTILGDKRIRASSAVKMIFILGVPGRWTVIPGIILLLQVNVGQIMI